jgi:hypothetical protein
MEKNPQDLSALLRGSPWYASALRGSRVDRVIVLWLRIGRRSRLEGFVAQVVARDGTLIDRPIIGGTVWTIDRGVRSAILDERRRSLEEGWSHVLEITSQPTAIVGHRLAALHRALLESLPRAMRSSFIHTTLVDLHEAASLLHRSRIADASGQGTLLETRSTSLADLAALAGVPLNDREIAEDDLRAGRAVGAIWSKLLLPRFATIAPSGETLVPMEAEPTEPPVRSTLPPEIAAILEAPASDGPTTSVSEPRREPTPDRYLGVPVNGGWELRRGSRTLGGPLSGHALTVVLLTDLLGEPPSEESIARLYERVIDELPSDIAFEISDADLRALLD